MKPPGDTDEQPAADLQPVRPRGDREPVPRLPRPARPRLVRLLPLILLSILTGKDMFKTAYDMSQESNIPGQSKY